MVILIGYFAEYCDEDPLKMLIQIMSEVGYDIPSEDYEWAFDVEDEEGEKSWENVNKVIKETLESDDFEG